METWHALGEKTDLQNFEYLAGKQNTRRATKGRHPGGISLYCKVEYCNILSKPALESSSSAGIQWLIFEKDNLKFGFCTVYNPPRDSEYFEENFFDELSNNMIELETKFSCSKFLIGGDFNARISTWQNFTNVDDLNLDEWDDLGEDRIKMPERRCKDDQINANGRDLKLFCQANNLVVVNGANEIMDDAFTFISPSTKTGSTIDLVLSSVNFFNQIKSLKVEESTLSYHFPVCISVRLPPVERVIVHEQTQSIKIENYKWKPDEESLEFLTNRMSSMSQLFFCGILFFARASRLIDAINLFLLFFKTICINLKLNTQVHGDGHSRKHMCPWFNDLCRELKKKVTQSLRYLRRKNDDHSIKEYIENKKLYSEAKKEAKKQYWDTQFDLIKNACKRNNPSTIWKHIKKYTGKFKPNQASKIESKQWADHFDKVLNKHPANKVGWNFDETVVISDDDFDRPITKDEVLWSLGKIKRGKSAGPDRILGDFLKFFRRVLAEVLTCIFNAVWLTATFPTIWARAIIVPLHKKGSTLETNNYRGISLLSHVGKVLTRILNKRLVSWINFHSLISDCQAGFRKHYSTLDNIFILETVIQDRLNRKGGALYTCMVDLKKCFDWIDRKALFYKLHKLGLPTKMMSVLKDYYDKSAFSVRVDSSHTTEYRKTISGCPQGCQLSPQLFTLFINDVVDILGGSEVHAPEISGTSVHCLLYADDLVLLSCSPVGLQRMLNKLESYCKEWELEVSLEKTKVVVFKKGTKKSKKEKWFFDGKSVEVVQEYKYLGLLFRSSGVWSHHIQAARTKAEKACTALLRFVYKFRCLPISFFLKLFDSLVMPVLLHGSEIWGGSILGEKTNSNLESVALRFYKSILGVPKGTPSAGILLELDRLKMRDQTIINVIRFWLRISKLSQSRLVYKCLTKQISWANEGKQCWGMVVKRSLDCLGLSFAWSNSTELNKKSFMKLIKQKVKDHSREHCYSEVREKTSLSCYEEPKRSVEPAQQYDSLTPTQRRWLAIVRLNLKRSLPVEERDGELVCKICSAKISSNLLWKHFFIQGCHTVKDGSVFKHFLGFKEISELAIKNKKSFLDKTEKIIKLLAYPPKACPVN